jgi:hypothetical protein
MIKKKLTKLVGIKKEDFDSYVENKQIQVQEARLIPLLKTGDEMALTSILLSSLRLVKEFRGSIFKELKLSRSGKVYYYTEATFPEIDSYRIDGFGSRFGSTRKFIDLTEDLVLRYYEGVVQHLSNWKRPAPKLNAE